MVIVKALARLTRNVNRVPVVGGVNRLMGGVLGAAEAFLRCYLIGMAVTVLITFSENGWSWLKMCIRDSTMGEVTKYFLISDPQGAGPLTHGYG